MSPALRWLLVRVLLGVILYAFGAVLLGSLGMDIHWRGFH